jgi:hypothetical protein
MISPKIAVAKNKAVYRFSGGDHAGRRTPPFCVNCRHFPDSESMTNSCLDPVLVDEKIT